MRKFVNGLFFGACILFFNQAAFSADPGAIAGVSYAEQPFQLLRATSLYVGERGMRLHDGDLIATDKAGIQLENLGSGTIAVGPASRVYVKLGPGLAELVLLAGWMKVQQGPPGGALGLTVSAGNLRWGAGSSSAIVRTSSGKTDLFVEIGELAVIERGGQQTVRTSHVSHEQYAVLLPKQPLKLLPRAPKEFLASMPPAFFDTLVAVILKGSPVLPKLDHPAKLSEVAPWVADDPSLSEMLHLRFNPPKPAGAKAPTKPAPGKRVKPVDIDDNASNKANP